METPNVFLAIVFGTLFLLIFLCGSGAFVTYRRFNDDSNFGGKFSDLRESVGGENPNKTRDLIARAATSEAEEAEQITQWLDEGLMEIDTPRFVMEMQRTGLSNGSVKPLIGQSTSNLASLSSAAIGPLRIG